MMIEIWQEEQEFLCHLRDERDAMKRSNTILPPEPCSACGCFTRKACVTCRDAAHCDACNTRLNKKYTREGDGMCFECREDTGTLIEEENEYHGIC